MLRRILSGLPRFGLVEAKGAVTRPWADYFLELATRINTTPFQVQAVRLTTQGAAITTTSVPIAGLTEGLYRVSYTLRITRAATTSSSVTLTLGWVDATVACTQAFAAVTGNTTATVQSGSVLVRCDAAGPLSYAVTYASVGATSAQFALDLVVEAVPGVEA